MRILKTEIENLRRFKSWKTDLPAVAIIQGKNGRGKSSYLDILRYCFSRGHDEDVIRAGQPRGSCILTFDDGGQVRCVADRDKSETTRAYKKPGAKKWDVSRAEIDRIAVAISYDPLSFIKLPERGTGQKPGQLETLLQIMPITLEESEITAALGDVSLEQFSPPSGLNAFDTLGVIHKAIYDRRTNLNAQADSMSKHSAELEKSLGPKPEAGEDWAAMAKEADALVKEFADAIAAENAATQERFTAAKQYEVQEYVKAVEQADREAQEAILSIERKKEKRKADAVIRRDSGIEEERAAANTAVDATEAKYEPQLIAARDALTLAKEREQRDRNSEGTRLAAKVASDQAAELKAQSAAITTALANLVKLKTELAGRLVIPGIEIHGGRICSKNYDGDLIPFNSWNKAAQMSFCLRIGVLAHGEAGFLLCDETEAYDSETREALLQAAHHYAETEGMQFIMASVGDQDDITVIEG